MDNGITVEQILADMERFLEVPEDVQPGDVTVKDVCDHFQCGKEKALVIMNKMVTAGGYKLLKAGPQRKVVLRKE